MEAGDSGRFIYRYRAGLFTDISNAMSSGELATFTLTLEGFGTPDYVFNENGDLVPILSDLYKKLLSDNNDVTLTIK